MTDPVLHLMEKALIKKGKQHLTGYVPNYFCMRLALGMVNPTRIDDIWDPDAAAYNPRLSRLLSRRKFWELHRYARPNVVELVAKCSKHWAAAWIVGAFVAGDEAIAPHKGKGPMRMYIPRKPHATGIKLYVLADATAPYVLDMYIYKGKCRLRGARRYKCAGRFTASEITNYWADQLPRDTTLVCDSFFGSHKTADSLASRGIPFLFLVPKNTKGVPAAGQGLKEGAYRVGHTKAGYSLYAFKSPKVGSKAGKVVPMLTNCEVVGQFTTHKRGYELPTVVQVYRQASNGVDVCNQLALQLRETNRMRTWSAAVRALVMRYAAVNAYTASNVLGVRQPSLTLGEFQWLTIKAVFPDIERPIGGVVHVPVQCDKVRMRCKQCGGETNWMCSGCGDPLHVKCFAVYHNV